MDENRDPVARGTDDSVDLYDIATWEERSRLDWFATKFYGLLVASARAFIILLAIAILLVQFALGGLAAITDPSNPWVAVFVLLSVVPAFALAAYIWHADVTMSEPLPLLVGTFLLGVLFAGFAAIFNSYTQPLFSWIPLVGSALFFYIVVGPIEETVKLLAVRLFAFRSDRFDAVIDGAVYGAMAGLGFATIENALYISQGVLDSSGTDPLLQAGQTAVFRLFAGPGHVIYSAFAGYYLGLAKFNRENAGPIVVKGLFIAAVIHATYNTLVGFVPGLASLVYPSVTPVMAYIVFVFIYDGFFGYLLYRKLDRYRDLYEQTGHHDSVTFGVGEGSQVAETGRTGEKRKMVDGAEVSELNTAETDDSNDSADETDSIWDDDPFGYDRK
ncbi:PrsW family intramembrane metalloprotease [Haladaptatus cibarius]|uniref:PrsW family intramembrane metalloprotease n=1 Tax=Haladaptatus cibarius TaxID=453847 RepID=UPI000678DB64|nr:PrsW family intramembrane metalloprotease [Haladaptatus cibarius]